MFLVGGGILTHGIPVLHQWIEQAAQIAGTLAGVAAMFADGVFGIAAGAIVLAVVTLASKIFRKSSTEAP